MSAYNLIINYSDGTTEEWTFDHNPNTEVNEWIKQDTGWVNIQGILINLNNVKRMETKEIDGGTD
ncbi:hypothetical protein JCM19046_998 [Bacillus sp. JCM 19046]|uniref:Uncharacterized protein n=1 Tax=Shouchella xiaoxiensis TaxID=766895 RepID=A0ABS2SXL4_9BACI|nr:hypothetical protein [Shouchella xiaoxiensis]MBM7840277.1 hypothetical protein [Shouchella xiaoxiensis]GAF14683.1 hypothetical protein JCM19045_4008 [Bacillus sp. JCM 19045]GAF16554.1 hypothetical protein JCM19046_998 [Bacillus sp. JCM 19046]